MQALSSSRTRGWRAAREPKGPLCTLPSLHELSHLARCGVRQGWWRRGGSHYPYPQPRIQRAGFGLHLRSREVWHHSSQALPTQPHC